MRLRFEAETLQLMKEIKKNKGKNMSTRPVALSNKNNPILQTLVKDTMPVTHRLILGAGNE